MSSRLQNQPLASRTGAIRDEARYFGKSEGVLRESPALRYAVIQRHRRVWPISVQCRVLGGSVAGLQDHFVRQASVAPLCHLSDKALLVHIKAVHAQSRGASGGPRIWRELRARGIRLGKPQVQQLMQRHGVPAKGKRPFKANTDSNHQVSIAPNLLDRQSRVAAPDRVWVDDITYIAPMRAGCSWLW